MPDALEPSLAHVLREAAEAAPEPAYHAGEALLRERARRAEVQARRRSRLLAAAAALTVLVVLFAAVTAIKLVRGQEVRPSSQAPTTTHTNYKDGATITGLWPDAVRTVPASIDIGDKRYKVNIQRVLPDGHVLVSPVGDDPEIPYLWSMDPATGAARPISPAGQLVVIVAQPGDEAGARWIVWGAAPKGGINGGAPVYLWYAPVEGGTARRATAKRFTTEAAIEAGQFRLLIVDDTVVITPPLGARADQEPFSVNTVELGGDHIGTLKSSRHEYVLQWPWVADDRSPGNTTVRNVGTGEKRKAKVPGGWTDVSCSLSWCLGRHDDETMVVRRDGSDSRALTAHNPDFGIFSDRFVIVTGQTAYDLLAKKSLTLPRAVGESSTTWHALGNVTTDGVDALFVWERTDEANQPLSYLIIETGKMI